jgi:hypothetical protein
MCARKRQLSRHLSGDVGGTSASSLPRDALHASRRGTLPNESSANAPIQRVRAPDAVASCTSAVGSAKGDGAPSFQRRRPNKGRRALVPAGELHDAEACGGVHGERTLASVLTMGERRRPRRPAARMYVNGERAPRSVWPMRLARRVRCLRRVHRPARRSFRPCPLRSSVYPLTCPLMRTRSAALEHESLPAGKQT